MTAALRLGLAAILAAGAVLTALLAADVRAWPSALAAGDAVYAAEPAAARWQPSTSLGGAAGALLGTTGEVRLRTALRLYREAAAMHLRLDNAVEVEAARARAQDALSPAGRSSDPRAASQALTLLGILAFRASAASAPVQTDAAISDFDAALRADPTDSEAAYDLELLLRLTAAHGTRVQPGQGAGFGRSGHRGAGGGTPGSGY